MPFGFKCCQSLFRCHKQQTPSTSVVKKTEDELPNLHVFDFDHTILDSNSDTAIVTLLREPVPMEIRNFYDGSNWTEYMDKIMVFVAQQKVTIELIERLLREIRLTPGMAELLENIRIRRLSKIGTQLVIISDANNFFIETVLNNLHPPIIPDEIIANRAMGTRIAHKTGPDNQDEEVTYLKIEAYEDQIDCKMCPKNLCKGKALREYIEKHGPFGRVFYAGDGRNDICAGMALAENDVLFVRKGYSMEKAIMSGQIYGQDIFIKAKIYYFVNGDEISKVVGFK